MPFAFVFLLIPSTAIELPPEPVPVQEQTVLVLDLGAEGIPASQARLITGRVASEVTKLPHLTTTTREDLQRLMELDSDRTLMECNVSSCMSEVADALGADFIVSGRVGKIGADLVTVQLALFDQAGAVLQRVDVDAKSTGKVAQEIHGAVAQLFAGIAKVDSVEPAPAFKPLLLVGGVTTATGVLVMGLSGGLLWYMNGLLNQPGTEVSSSQKTTVKDSLWIPLTTLGVGALIGLGGAGLLTYGVME